MSCRIQTTPMVHVEEEQMDQTKDTDVKLAKNPQNVKLANEKSLSTL